MRATVSTPNLEGDPALARSVRMRPGLRVPGAWDGVETAIVAVLAQGVGAATGRRLAGRLAQRFGQPAELPGDGVLIRQFPSPQALATAPAETIGVSPVKARAIRTLSERVRDGALTLDGAMNPDAVARELQTIPGIGARTAHVTALRLTGHPDAFAPTDVGLRRALACSLAPRAPAAVVTEAELRRRAERWRPWRAHAAMHLWLGPP